MKKDLKCEKCGACDCKLWRPLTGPMKMQIYCTECVLKKMNLPTLKIEKDKILQNCMSTGNIIGFFIPAIWNETKFYDYFRIPKKAYASWQKLPTFHSKIYIAI